MSPEAISVAIRRSPSPPIPPQVPSTIDEIDLRDADDAGHSPPYSTPSGRIQETDETPKSPGAWAPESGDLESTSSDSTKDGRFQPPRPRSAKIPERTRLRRVRNRYYGVSDASDASDASDHRAQRRPVKPRVKRLVAGHLSQIGRDTASSIDVYYRGAVPEAVVNAASSTDKPPVGHADALRQHVDCPWAVQVNSTTVVGRLAEVLEVPVATFPDPLIITHPFKILVAYAEKLSPQPSAPAPAQIPDPGYLSDPDQVRPTREERGRPADHLRCLQEVLAIDFQPLTLLRRSLREASLTKISFEDLWHVFRPGDLVLSKSDGREQLYRVLEAQQSNGPTVPRAVVRPRRPRRPISESDFSETEDSETEAADANAFHVCCVNLNFDGTSIGPVSARVPIHYFPGEKDITALNIFPVKFLSSSQNIQNRMAARGKRFLACQGHMRYDGTAYRPASTKPTPSELQGEVYVDVKTGYRAIGVKHRPLVTRARVEELFDRRDNLPVYEGYGQYSRRSRVPEITDHAFVDKVLALQAMDAHSEALNTIAFEEAADLSPELCQLLPSHILAYAFQARKWYFVDIDYVQSIDKSDSALQNSFHDLVIPEAYRDLLIALVQSHTSENRQKTSMDLVQGKGRGLFILLHGPPGVGKTSTAELIAMYTKRPLYSITCGDIGLTPRAIERNLSKHFSLANKWGCVLLLDEADVFLMKRDWRDMNRNALVSVFLRVLEYYSGILFLTTNRIGVIDEAFKSRVHICLRYPTISIESTRSIWENQLSRITRENADKKVKIVFNKAELFGFADKHYKHHAASGTTWNGRQIRNAFQTAIALGQHDRTTKLRENGMTEEDAEASGKEKYMTIKLTRGNFRKIAKTAKDFEDYMVSVRGSDTVLAQEEALRDDGFDPDNMVPAQKDYRGLLSVSVPGARRSRSGNSPPHGPAGGSLYTHDNKGGRMDSDSSESDSEDDY
ncbi:hypothetical protein BJY00DRAFT_314164 [Aspergillus carlsbadensis]|nr:hypothetical protein BJY00DRAFT_314164 [Aspergillus carlsbadensis]